MLMVIPTPFVEKTMAGIKDKLRPDQVGWLVAKKHLAEEGLHLPSHATFC